MAELLFQGSPFEPGEIAKLECVRTGQLTMGRFTQEFEKSFAATVGSRYAVMVNSGSSANLLALSVLKQRRPDMTRIGVPAVTWPTTLAPIVQLGLTPVLIDVSLETLCLDDRQYGADIHGIFNVHLLGNPVKSCWPDQIEDCCEALGSRLDNMDHVGDHDHAGRRPHGMDHVGNQGQFGTYSFYFAHHLTTIEGGMVTTNDEQLYEELVMQRAHGWIRDLPAERQAYYRKKHPDIDERFLFPTLGYNLRPTEIQAELGLRQLKYLPQWHLRRFEIAMRFRDAAESRSCFLPYHVNPGVHSWFAYPLVLKDGGVEARKRLQAYLQLAEVPSRPIVGGNLAAQPFMQKFGIKNTDPLDNAEHIQRHGLYVPISQMLDEAQIVRTVDAIASWG